MSKPLSEWRFFWYLPLVGALGYATSTIYVYSLGPFIAPIRKLRMVARSSLLGNYYCFFFDRSVFNTAGYTS